MVQSKAPSFTLYEYRASPFCVAVRLALNEIEVTFTPREVDLDKPRTAAFLKRSPFGRLPALVEHRPSGELAVFESPAILVFLAERFQNSPIAFSDLPSKSQALSWLSAVSSGLAEQVLFVLNECHLVEDSLKRLDLIAQGKKELERQLDVLDKHLARRAYLAGAYSIADTLATPILDLLEFIPDLDLDGFPHVKSWRDRLRERPSYKGVWPHDKK